MRILDTFRPSAALTCMSGSVQRLARVLGVACALLAAGPTLADTTRVSLEGWVTETADPAYAVGDPVELAITYSPDFVSWWNGGAGDGQVQVTLSGASPIADLVGLWTRAEVTCFDRRTGTELPTCLDGPFFGLRLDVALDAGDGTDQVLFAGELFWNPADFPALIDGTEFYQHFDTGQLELIEDGATVLRATIVPEPSTALLLACGLTALAQRRRARP